MGKREMRRAQQQRAVLQATVELLRERNADAIKMSDIAQRMDASVGGLYRYYSSKEAILAALQIQALDQLQTVLKWCIEENLELEGGYTWSMVETLFDAWIIFEREAPTLAMLLDRFSVRSAAILTPEDQSLVGRKIFETLDILKETIEALTAHDVLSPSNPNIRAFCLWGIVFGFLQLRRRQRAGMAELPLSEIRLNYLEDLRRSWAH